MSLQYYDIALGINGTREVSAQGRFIYYRSGSTPLIDGGAPSAAGNQAIKVTAGTTGSSIILMPGQSLRLPENEKRPAIWRVANYLNNEVITGVVLIGEGEFRDSNTSNTSFVKLDATFANNVKVTNDASARVPVQLDPTTIINVAGATVQYTNSWVDAGTANVLGQMIFSAAANPNGAFIEFAEMSLVANAATAQSLCQLMVKATAPANVTDGDCVMIGTSGNTPGSTSGGGVTNLVLGVRIKVPAGKGLWLNQSQQVFSSAVKTVLYTLL
jgi:hypothetical protein